MKRAKVENVVLCGKHNEEVMFIESYLFSINNRVMTYMYLRVSANPNVVPPQHP